MAISYIQRNTYLSSGREAQDGFWIQIKIQAEYISLMPRLPENSKKEKQL